MNEKMNIALCMNSKYVMPSMVCITSILENNKSPIDFYILYSNLTDREIDSMKRQVEKYGKQYSLIPIKIDEHNYLMGPIHGRSKEAYYRLLIPTVLPESVERCLYIDGDTLIQKPLDVFYNSPFEDKALIVCEDVGEILFFHKERHSVLNIPIEYRYFNSGVLLFNLTYFREGYDSKIIFDYIENNPEKLKFLDQDVLNALFYDKVKFSYSSLYDYLEILVSHLLVNDNMDKAVIIHFLQKPWRYNYNGVNAKYWWKYGKKIYKLKYFKFSIINFIYRKCLGILLLFIPMTTLKKIKNGSK
jgi:lipopolysaccharide biosynthesis glycosyltransferase